MNRRAINSKGIYYQAVEGQRFEVAFLRVK